MEKRETEMEDSSSTFVELNKEQQSQLNYVLAKGNKILFIAIHSIFPSSSRLLQWLIWTQKSKPFTDIKSAADKWLGNLLFRRFFLRRLLIGLKGNWNGITWYCCSFFSVPVINQVITHSKQQQINYSQ